MLYLITLEDSRLIKVGYTDNLKNRLKDYNGLPIRLLDVIEGNQKDEKAYPNLKKAMDDFDKLNDYIKDKKVVSAYVQDFGSVSASLIKMALGNKLGFTIDYDKALDFSPCSIVVEAIEELDFKKIGEVTEAIKVNGIEIDLEEAEKSYMSTLEEIYPTYYNLDKGKVENISNKASEKIYYKEKVDEVKVVIPVFPGTNSEYDTQKAFEEAGASVKQVIFTNTREDDIKNSIDEFVREIKNSHIIAFPGGFSAGDEPDGSAKFIVNIIKNEAVKEAIHAHLADKKLILGICNGFQALIKSGLLPYGKICDLDSSDLSLFRNTGLRHISDTAITRVSNTNSAWTQNFEIGDLHELVFSHGEGRLVGEKIEEFKDLAAFQYVNPDGDATLNGKYNPNGSVYAIEAMLSPDGLILGKMGHSERSHVTLYKTNTIKDRQDIFKNGVEYFTR